jgi:hypothetical protein
MSDDPLDRIPSFDRISIRAVLVHEGEDPGPALREAGIIDAVALPVMLDDDSHHIGGFLGDGITDNLTAVLEPDVTDDEEEDLADAPHAARSWQNPDTTAESRPVGVARLPEAFGSQPLAPVRRKR